MNTKDDQGQSDRVVSGWGRTIAVGMGIGREGTPRRRPAVLGAVSELCAGMPSAQCSTVVTRRRARESRYSHGVTASRLDTDVFNSRLTMLGM